MDAFDMVGKGARSLPVQFGDCIGTLGVHVIASVGAREGAWQITYCLLLRSSRDVVGFRYLIVWKSFAMCLAPKGDWRDEFRLL